MGNNINIDQSNRFNSHVGEQDIYDLNKLETQLSNYLGQQIRIGKFQPSYISKDYAKALNPTSTLHAIWKAPISEMEHEYPVHAGAVIITEYAKGEMQIPLLRELCEISYDPHRKIALLFYKPMESEYGKTVPRMKVSMDVNLSGNAIYQLPKYSYLIFPNKNLVVEKLPITTRKDESLANIVSPDWWMPDSQVESMKKELDKKWFETLTPEEEFWTEHLIRRKNMIRRFGSY